VTPEEIDQPLTGHVALVTGVGSGIGRATAIRLAADGVAIACLGRRSEPLETTVAEIEAAGGRAVATPADVTDPEAVRRAVTTVTGRFGTIDILVNNAGVPGEGRFVNIGSEATWLGHTSVEYATAKSALLGFTRALARQVVGQGVLVNLVAPGPV
jgi:NAD(P)-dependent dehydrogenase (short-subunit alcohol dehydrogenase family)